MEIRSFVHGNEYPISALIRRTLCEVNAADCPAHEIAYLYGKYDPDTVASIAETGHTYVLWHTGKIIGCGSVILNGDMPEIVAAFLLPEFIGQGYGRKLFEALESDELCIMAGRVWLTSSVTALPFYEKMGYTYRFGYRSRGGEDNLIEMEKNL